MYMDVVSEGTGQLVDALVDQVDTSHRTGLPIGILFTTARRPRLCQDRGHRDDSAAKGLGYCGVG
jgi:hypothetical protein